MVTSALCPLADMSTGLTHAEIGLRAHSNCRNLDFHIARQARYLDCRACRRRVLEVRSVDFVHLSELVNILEEHGGRNNMVHCQPVSLKHGLQVIKNTPRLILNRRVPHWLATLWIYRDLPGA